MTIRLRARWVLPVTGPPIEDGEVVIEGERISAVHRVRSSARSGRDVRDFGEAIILPGLINVHAHLDYTVMRGLLEDLPFFPWVRELTARKEALDEEDWLASALMGAAEAVAGGVTTLADCSDSGAGLPALKAVGMRGIIYQEVFGVDESESVRDILTALFGKLEALRREAQGSRVLVGVSPHAPYTVRPELLKAVCAFARSRSLRICIHAAESQAEAEWLRHGSGPIGEMFERRGVQWHLPPPGCSTVGRLDSLGVLGPDVLLVHGVQIAAEDRAMIGGSGTAWAHCPKSNAKLGAGIAPFSLLRECYRDGPHRIGLGSDSVASNNTMDLFEEMRFAVLMQRGRQRSWDAMTARDALDLATIGGARALGVDADVGSIEPGKQADIVVVRTDGLASAPCYDPFSALVYAGSARDVEFTMVAGQLIYERGLFPRANLAAARARSRGAARKLRDWRST